MLYKTITPITTEPLSVDEAKLHIRITESETAEDTEILTFIIAAREYCENFTGRALATQTLEMYLNGFPMANEIELPKSPLQSVITVKYKNSDGVETTMVEDTDYIVDEDRETGRIVLPYGKTWPVFTPYSVNPIKIQFIAGYDTNNLVPRSVKQAMLLLVGHWYANREAVGKVEGQIEFAVNTLLSMTRVRWF